MACVTAFVFAALLLSGCSSAATTGALLTLQGTGAPSATTLPVVLSGTPPVGTSAGTPTLAPEPGTCLIVPQEYCDTAAVVTLNYAQPSAKQAFKMDWVGLTVPPGTPIFAPEGGNFSVVALQPIYESAGYEIDLPLRGILVGPTSSPTALWILVVSPIFTALPDVQVTSGEIIATAVPAPAFGLYNLLVEYAARSDSNLHPDASHLKAVFGLH